ncbi:MAG: phosphotransferase [Actinomycetota bacterium]
MIRGVDRIDFFEMPTPVVAAVNRAIDGAVAAYDGARRGFSPGPAGRADLVDGRSVFVKACCDDLSPVATAMHRKEAGVLAQLPVGHPSPSLLATVDVDGWFVLVTEYVPGTTPTAPITASETAAVLDLVTVLARAGTPTPTTDLKPFNTEPDRIESWSSLGRSSGGGPDGLDPWSRHHLGALIRLEAGWVDAVAGSSLVHGDLRPDNMVLSSAGGADAGGAGGEGRSVAVDWPGGTVGAPWVDLVGSLPALNMLGGPAPADVFDAHPLGREADGDAVTSFLVALTGYFTSQALKPELPTVPGLRRFQADQGAVCRTWLSQRLGWDPPDPRDVIAA